MSKSKRENLSIDEEMLMWTSYRYCIGRHTYVSTLAPYIGKKYYPLLSDERAEFTAKDIKECINNCLSFQSLSFTYDGSIPYDERDGLSDFLTWINENVESEKDLVNIDSIECYKESYGADVPKKFFTTQKKRLILPKYESDYSDLLVWHQLAQLFDKKNHKKVWINDNGEEKCVECFEYWAELFVADENEDNSHILHRKPYKYVKRITSVDNYLKYGERCGYLDDEYIIKIE